MNKPNWNFCIIFLLVIILSLFIGMKYIKKEGLSDFSTIPDEDMTQTLLNSEKSLSNAKSNLNAAIVENKGILFKQSVEQAGIDTLKQQYIAMENEFYNKKSQLITNTFLNAIVCLYLYKDAMNTAPLTIPTAIYDNYSMNYDVNGNPTNLSFTNYNGRKCIKFNNDMNNYISFPILLFPNYSFCFWIYLNNSSRDNNYYTVASVTYAPQMNPGLQVDIQGLHVMVYNALPNHWDVQLKYNAPSEGWYHITYTYDSNASNPSSPKNKYLAKLYVNGVDSFRQGNSSPYGSGDILANVNKSSRPNRFILGRSGDNGRAFNGYVSDFNYYAITLPVGDINTQNTVNYVYKKSETQT